MRKENAAFTADDLSGINDEKIDSDVRIDQLKIEIAELKAQYGCQVMLPKMLLREVNKPKNIDSLLKLEDVISMIEVYLWISNHYAESFT